MIFVWLYPLLFFLFDRKYHRLGGRLRDWVVYGLVMASAVLFCICAVRNVRLPNPIDGLAKILGQ